MDIGLIIYSQTGNTLSVAERLAERLRTAGHSTVVDRIEVAGDGKAEGPDIRIERRSDIMDFDALVFASPVHAFSLAPAMKSYLRNIDALDGKKVGLFVTKALPGKSTGGNRAIRTMKRIIESKGGEVVTSGIIVWSEKHRERMTAEVVERLARNL